MEKLIELLNEYEPFICGDGTYTDNHWSYVLDGHSAVYPKSVAKNVIISKSYGFIKRLVENDKINRGKFGVEYTDKQTLKDIYIAGAKEDELLIMLLSISDTPIEDLLTYLQDD